MSAKVNNIRIGIFVLVAIFLLIVGLLAFGARSFFAIKTTYETAIVGEVDGLSVGSSVIFRGVPIGKVSLIDFAPNVYPDSTSTVIVVEFEVDRKILRHETAEQIDKIREQEIQKGLRCTVKAQSITGTSIISINYLNPIAYPPPILDYTPANPYIPSAPSQFARLVESIEQTLQNFQNLDLKSIGFQASNALASAALVLQKVDHLNLESSVGNLNTLVTNLNDTVVNINTTISKMDLHKLGGNANDLVASLKETNLKLQTTLDHVNSAPVADTVENLRSSLRTLNEVLQKLNQYPSGFILGEPPLPAQSVKPSPK